MSSMFTSQVDPRSAPPQFDADGNAYDADGNLIPPVTQPMQPPARVGAFNAPLIDLTDAGNRDLSVPTNGMDARRSRVLARRVERGQAESGMFDPAPVDQAQQAVDDSQAADPHAGMDARRSRVQARHVLRDQMSPRVAPAPQQQGGGMFNSPLPPMDASGNYIDTQEDHTPNPGPGQMAAQAGRAIGGAVSNAAGWVGEKFRKGFDPNYYETPKRIASYDNPGTDLTETLPQQSSMFNITPGAQARPLAPEETARALSPQDVQARQLGPATSSEPQPAPAAGDPPMSKGSEAAVAARGAQKSMGVDGGTKGQPAKSMMTPSPAADTAQPAAAPTVNSQSKEYLDALKTFMAPDAEETPKEKRSRLQKALLVGGLSMMSAASKPGATFFGSAGEGGLAGVGASEKEQAMRLAKAKDKRERGMTLAKAGYEVGKDDRTAGQKDQEIAIQRKRGETEDEWRRREAEHQVRVDAETGRYHSGELAARNREVDSADAARKNPKSAVRDQAAVIGESYDTAFPKRADESAEDYAARRGRAVYRGLTERKGDDDAGLIKQASANLGKDINYNLMENGLDKDAAFNAEVERLRNVRPSSSGGDGGGVRTAAPAKAPSMPTDASKRVKGQKYSTPNGAVVTWTGTGWVK